MNTFKIHVHITVIDNVTLYIQYSLKAVHVLTFKSIYYYIYMYYFLVILIILG